MVDFVTCSFDTGLHSIGQLKPDAANIFIRLWAFFLLDLSKIERVLAKRRKKTTTWDPL
jgi:hypothetical protein